MLGTILSLVMGGIPSIVREIAQAKNNLENAKTDREKVFAEERVKALEAKRDVLVSESRTPWNHIARFTLLAPFAFYLTWVTAWDKIACKWFLDQTQCTTDPLSDWLSAIAMMIIGFYFVTDWTRTIKK